jgi:transposase
MKPVELDEKGWPTKEWLEEAYLEEGLSTLAIAQMTGRAASKINVRMHQFNIPMRKPVEVDRNWLEQKYVVERLPVKDIAREAGVKPDRITHLVRTVYKLPLKRPICRQFQPTREWLVQKYVVENLSSAEICELTGYSKGGLQKLIREYRLERKGRSLPKLNVSKEELYQLHVVEGLTAVRIAQKFGCHNSTISRLIKEYELDPERPLVNIPATPPLTRDELWKMYWVDQMSTQKIADHFEVSKSTAQRWFKMLEVSTRKWNGGEVKRTYVRTYTKANRFGQEFNAQERERIMQRDGMKCRMPGCSSKSNLEVHHIIPIEHDGTNALDNGITLCHKCHESIRRRELQFVTLFQELLINPQN